MAFTPKNSAMNPFAKKSGGEFKQTATDTLFEVVEYDIDTAAIVAKRVSDGKICNVSVSYDAVNRGRKSERAATTASWFGHLIDARMASIIEVGNKFIAERALWVRNQKGGNPLYECSRIINLTDQSEGKIIQGLLTVSGWDGRIRSVQEWAKESFLSTDVDGVGRTAAALDDVSAKKASGLFPVELGFMFRVIRGDLVVETSQCYDFVQAVKDELGNELSPRRTPTGEEFVELLSEFTEYAAEKYSGSSAHVEVCTYKSFNASKMSKSMEVNEKSQGYRMISSQSKIDSESDIIQQGKNLAVNGVISLTSDAADKKTRTFVQRDMVNKVFLNGTSGNVNSFIRSPGGVKVRFADELKIFAKKEDQAPAQQQQALPEVSFEDDPFSGQQPAKQKPAVDELLFDEELDWDNV